MSIAAQTPSPSGDGGSPACTDKFSDLLASLAFESSGWSAADLELLAALGELTEAYKVGRTDNWDAEGAQPVTPEIYQEARRFLKSLPPLFVPAVDVAPEPSGSLSFEWQARPGWTFVVAVVGRSVLEYAGTFGVFDEVHGRLAYTDSIPATILSHLNACFGRQSV